ncbi:hypothetical protein F2Q69_00053496 [Brassica cretica]|uniref:Uncharacterized protein n=1 Tax=Brassica cretica TaxID=69181 RepID=A0A8S9MQ69_BRACR|nr:hypothetical protein F2Q69_00053496 [Brassica cretica]
MDKIICYSLKIHIKFLFRPSSSPVRVTNPSHRLFPTLAGLDTDYTPDIEADPSHQGFYGVKLHCLNLFLLVTPRSIVQECGFASLTCYYITAASPSHYAVSSIDGSSQSLICGTPNLFVAETTVQKCRLARSTSYYATAAFPSHYAVSNIDSSSQSQLCDLQTRASILNIGYQMSFSSRIRIHRVFSGD